MFLSCQPIHHRYKKVHVYHTKASGSDLVDDYLYAILSTDNENQTTWYYTTSSSPMRFSDKLVWYSSPTQPSLIKNEDEIEELKIDMDILPNEIRDDIISDDDSVIDSGGKITDEETTDTAESSSDDGGSDGD